MSRMGRRLVRHHLPIVTVSLGIMLLVRSHYADKPVAFQWSMASAYVGLILLALSLVLGPVNILAGRPNPVSSDVRRDVGIWAGLCSLLHALVGLQVHMPHRYLYWLSADLASGALSVRMDPFGVTNFAGLFAVFVAALLLALSNDRSLRTRGTHDWKQLQRWNYVLFALVVLHGAIYQLSEKRERIFVFLFVALCLPVIALQYAGYRRKSALLVIRSDPVPPPDGML